MRFLVDACTGPGVAQWLAGLGHEVFSVHDECADMSDDAIIEKAFREEWILITNDKDFGEKVFRLRHGHHGVILLRLTNERVASKITVLDRLIANASSRLSGEFIVATETRVRFRRD